MRMIASAQIVDSCGNQNLVSFSLPEENNAELVMKSIENACSGFEVLTVTVVAEVNGKLATYAMRKLASGVVKTFNRTPMLVEKLG